MKTLKLLPILAVCMGLALLSGCTDKAPDGPTASLGSATVTKYVSVGNSLTAGYQSGALYASAQKYSYPNMIAQQLKKAGAALGSFEQPLYSDPGTPGSNGNAARYEILGATSTGSLNIGPRPGQAAGSPANAALARPYDNLGIPGIPLLSFMDTANVVNNALVPVVLRTTAPFNLPFRKSIFGQATSLNPDLVTFWLGANDVLGFATSGGANKASAINPAGGPTYLAVFTNLYNQALDTLRKALPNAKIVVANIPKVTAVPFFTTVNPMMAPAIAATPVKQLYYLKHANAGVDSTKLDNVSTGPLVTLAGKAYSAYLGLPTAQFWRDNLSSAALIPTLTALGIDTTKPFGLSAKNPWPDALILDPSEVATANQFVNDYNAVIAAAATAKNAALVNFNKIFDDIATKGYTFNGEYYTAAYVTGGIFSLDGVHPSNRGYGIVANEYIKVINSTWKMSIPYVDLTSLPGLSSPLAKSSGKSGDFIITKDFYNQMVSLFNPGN